MGSGRGRRTQKVAREEVLNLVKIAVTKGCRQSVACRDLGISEKTILRWGDNLVDQRRGPIKTPGNKLTSEEREEVLSVANCKEYMNKPPSQIVPLLADKGVYIASESTFYRILREENLLAHRGKSKAPNRKKPMPLIARGPNQIYSWDITYLKAPVRGTFFYLYMFLDIWSRKIVGWEVHENEDMTKSSQLIAKIYRDENLTPGSVTLHADNGGPMKGCTMLATLQYLGVAPSFSRPSVSNDNPYSESLFKTVKYCPQYPNKPFETLEAARVWVNSFVTWYNNEHLHSGVKFTTPDSRHRGLDKEILKKRNEVYEEAKQKNPNRWSGETRNWESRINPTLPITTIDIPKRT